MKEVYIVLHSSTTGGDCTVNDIQAVFAKKSEAVQFVLDEISRMEQYDEGPANGRRLCDNDVVVLDTENTTHNGGALKLTVPEEQFCHIRFYDDEDCPEWVRQWDIETETVLGTNTVHDIVLARLIKCERTKDWPVEFSKGLEIRQMSDGHGYLTIADLILEKIWYAPDEQGNPELYGQCHNADDETRGPMVLPLCDWQYKGLGETGWWELEALEQCAYAITPRPKWDFVNSEEFPDSNGHCEAGILTNGINFLYYNICRDDEEEVEHMSIHSSITMGDGTECCPRFPWTDENETLVLDTLNALPKDSLDYCGDDGALWQVEFHPAHKPQIDISRIGKALKELAGNA